MKRKIGAPKGRQLYGAPKGAPIMPNMVMFIEDLEQKTMGTNTKNIFFPMFPKTMGGKYKKTMPRIFGLQKHNQDQRIKIINNKIFCSKPSINIIWSVLQEKMMTKTFYFTFFWIFRNICCLKVPQYTICNDFEFYTTHIYTCIWLFYQLLYPFQCFCNPLILKIHHFGGTRCDFGNSREPEWLKIENWRQLARIFKNSPTLLKKLLQTCSWW